MRFTSWRLAGNVTSPWARQALVNKIATEKPDALFLTGDIPFQGADKGDYVVFQRETAVWNRSQTHIFPVLGNHEFYGRDFFSHRERGLVNWWNVFPYLKGMRWYSVQVGDQLYAICLDSDFGALRPESPQRIWMDHQLSALPASTKYIFVVLHHAPSGDYIEGHDGSEFGLDAYFERKQRTMHAQFVVICGHAHNYGRFESNGVTYIVSGGGGAHPVFFHRRPEDDFKGKDLIENGRVLPNFHYVKFELERDHLKASMIRIKNPEDVGAKPKWETADKFQIPSPPS